MEIRKIKLAEIHADPANPNKHSRKSIDAIKASLQEFKQVDPLVVQASSGKVIGGNGRFAAMLELGWTEADCVMLDISDIRATALGIALNRTAEFSERDAGELALLLAEIQNSDEVDHLAAGYSDEEIDAMIATSQGIAEGEANVAEGSVGTAGGDSHNLRVGDHVIPLTDPEYENLLERIDDYAVRNGGKHGFVAELLNV